MAADTIPEIDGFIHEAARLRVLALLSVLGRADFMYVLRQSGLSRGNLSVQMQKLEEADIVSVTKELADGRLVEPFGPELPGEPFHLVCPPERLKEPAIQAVRDWVLGLHR